MLRESIIIAKITPDSKIKFHSLKRRRLGCVLIFASWKELHLSAISRGEGANLWILTSLDGLTVQNKYSSYNCIYRRQRVHTVSRNGEIPGTQDKPTGMFFIQWHCHYTSVSYWSAGDIESFFFFFLVNYKHIQSKISVLKTKQMSSTWVNCNSTEIVELVSSTVLLITVATQESQGRVQTRRLRLPWVESKCRLTNVFFERNINTSVLPSDCQANL